MQSLSLLPGLRPVALALLVALTTSMTTTGAMAQRCGCAHCQPGVPAPLGSYNHAWQCGQVRAAHKALTIHRCDWIGESDRLSPFMQRYLLSKLTEGCTCCCRLLIEPSGAMHRDENRRTAVIGYLTQNDLGDYSEAVAIGYGTRDRLRGEDSHRVLENFGYQQTRSQTNQFNPFIGFGAPVTPGAGATVGGTALPSIQGLFGR